MRYKTVLCKSVCKSNSSFLLCLSQRKCLKLTNGWLNHWLSFTRILRILWRSVQSQITKVFSLMDKPTNVDDDIFFSVDSFDSRVCKNSSSYWNWVLNNGIHWIFCQNCSHPHQQHFDGRNINMLFVSWLESMMYTILWFKLLRSERYIMGNLYGFRFMATQSSP